MTICRLGISFVIAAYALLIAAYVFIIAIGRQLYKIFCGNAFCGVRTKKAWSNWRSFLF